MSASETAENVSAAPNGPSIDGVDIYDYVIEHIDEAIAKGWVRPYYQPVVRTLTGKLCGFEALARWDDPNYGLLTPFFFIPPLEHAQLIHLLDRSIIRQVCRHYRECVNLGKPVVPVLSSWSEAQRQQVLADTGVDHCLTAHRMQYFFRMTFEDALDRVDNGFCELNTASVVARLYDFDSNGHLNSRSLTLEEMLDGKPFIPAVFDFCQRFFQ